MLICGVDEVGRGCLAGEVVAAAVILKDDSLNHDLRDSKKLSAGKREILSDLLQNHAYIAIASANIAEIDTLNILQASLLAMSRAVVALPLKPDHIYVDGIHKFKSDIPMTTVVGGDDLYPCISAASIVAKVYRDNRMNSHALDYPGYGFENHKGYGTKQHLNALRTLGVTPLHRTSFAPIRNLLTQPCLL